MTIYRAGLRIKFMPLQDHYAEDPAETKINIQILLNKSSFNNTPLGVLLKHLAFVISNSMNQLSAYRTSCRLYDIHGASSKE
jgi:hypothetical protein